MSHEWFCASCNFDIKSSMIKKNMGSTDKIIRIILALAIGGAYFAGLISGTVAIIGGVLALVFVATSFISFCPLYLPFGLSTLRSKAGK